MQIKLDRKSFLNGFLSPLNKISDKGVLCIGNGYIECLSSSSFDKKDQTIILYSKYIDDSLTTPEKIELNVPNFNKLINVFSFLNEDEVLLNIQSNNINYKSDKSGIFFKYHLLEDGVLEKPTIKMQNVYNMGFNFEGVIQKSTLSQLLKASSFADKTNKIYMYTKDNCLYGLLNDENLKNIDNIEFKVSDSFIGDDIKVKIPMSLEIYRVISSLNFENVNLKINTEKGIIMFEVKQHNYLLQYIVTSLVK
jgi:hypothetical protein